MDSPSQGRSKDQVSPYLKIASSRARHTLHEVESRNVGCYCVTPIPNSSLAQIPGRRPWPQCSWFSFHLYQVLTNKSHLWNEEEVWRMEIYLSLGVLALGMLSLLAVTSLPSIANSLNWREFSFVQVREPGPCLSHACAFPSTCCLGFHNLFNRTTQSSVPGAWQVHPGLLTKGLPGTSSSSQHLGKPDLGT